MGMSIDDCAKMLIAKEKCMSRETSGTDTDCNSHNCDECSLCYEQGTMGEQKEALKFAVDTMRKYQKLQADEENRLKADLVAMLTEIQLELDEMKITKVRSAGFAPYSKDPFRRGVNCSKEIIQQKINSLKAEKEKGKE